MLGRTYLYLIFLFMMVSGVFTMGVLEAAEPQSYSVRVHRNPATDAPRGVSPAGGTAIILVPGEIRRVFVTYTFDAGTVSALAFVRATPFLPEFVQFAFNDAAVVNPTTVTIQYRLTVDRDAPGGEFQARIIFELLSAAEAVVATREEMYPLIINAPPPPDDFGDDCDTSEPIALNSTVVGRVNAGGDRDFFEVVIAEAGTLEVFTTGQGDLLGEVLADNCTSIAQDDDSGDGGNFRIVQELEPGTYHVSVENASVNVQSDYLLFVDFTLLDPFVNELYIAQFGNGAGFSSRLQLLNTGADNNANALIVIRDDDGNAISSDFAPAGNGSPEGIPMVVPAGGLAIFETNGQGPLVSGSIVVRSDQPLEGAVVFGGTFGLAGVSSSPRIQENLIAPVQVGGASGSNTGIALQNLADSPLSFEAELLDTAGNLLATASAIQLPTDGHEALFVDQLEWSETIDFSDFVGVLRIRSTNGPFAATVLLTRPGQLASLPIVIP